MENRVFFPQAALDQWIVEAWVELQDGELTLSDEGGRFRLTEALRILREVSGIGDAHGLLGRVKARADLEQLGAEIIETSMLLGECAYDVEPGWVGLPSGTFPSRAALRGSSEAVDLEEGASVTQDTVEDVVARFLARAD
ncbi:MAG: hypothetical protein ABSC94_15225 [Polyangiaceae bacterium]|jgi:hypothetical protein